MVNGLGILKVLQYAQLVDVHDCLLLIWVRCLCGIGIPFKELTYP